MNINICIVASLLAVILSSITAGFAIFAYCKVVGMEKSTHQVQFMNYDQEEEQKKEKLVTPIDGEEPKKETILDQFRRMYPDVESEQV